MIQGTPRRAVVNRNAPVDFPSELLLPREVQEERARIQAEADRMRVRRLARAERRRREEWRSW